MRESKWYKVDLSPKMDNADIDSEGGDAIVVAGICAFPGTIKKIMVGVNTYPREGTVAIANGSVNLLAAATVDLATLTEWLAASQPLAAAKMDRRVAAGNMLKATWTFPDIGSGDGFAAEVWIEPDEF